MKTYTGHTSPETALITYDYPMGFVSRCLQRHWVETATSGAKKGEQRHVTQSSHKSFNREYTAKLGEGRDIANTWALEQVKAGKVLWCSPKASTYSDIIALATDTDEPISADNPLHTYHLGMYATAKQCRDFAAMNLTPEQEARRAMLERVSRRVNPTEWTEFDAQQGAATAAQRLANGEPVVKCGKEIADAFGMTDLVKHGLVVIEPKP